MSLIRISKETGSPVQRRLRMLANKRGVDAGAVRNQCSHGCFTVWKVARPVSGYVEQRTLPVDPCCREAGVFSQELLQYGKIALVDRLNGCKRPESYQRDYPFQLEAPRSCQCASFFCNPQKCWG